MIKKMLIVTLFVMAFFASGCSQTLADKQQQENLVQLYDSWQSISADLAGKEDDPATPDVDESVAPRIPSKVVLESHGDLLKESMELELAKKETWQDQAKSNDWEPRR